MLEEQRGHKCTINLMRYGVVVAKITINQIENAIDELRSHGKAKGEGKCLTTSLSKTLVRFQRRSGSECNRVILEVARLLNPERASVS